LSARAVHVEAGGRAAAEGVLAGRAVGAALVEGSGAGFRCDLAGGAGLSSASSDRAARREVA